MADHGFFQGQHLSQAQQMRQEIAPHQIQSLEILQLAVQDLHARIQDEMRDNPVLEVGAEKPEAGEGDGASTEESREAAGESDFGEKLLGDPMEDSGALGSNTDDVAGMAAEKDEFLASLMQADEGWRDYLPPQQAQRYAGTDDEEKRRFFFDSLTTQESLEEVLLEQLRTSEAGDDLKQVGEVVIGSIDTSGYLRSKPEEIAVAAGADLAVVNDAIKLIQSFEPPGVGARDLRECLLLQLERKDKKDSLAYKAVDKFLDKIARNRIPEVARGLRISKVSLYEVMNEIKQLQPRPGNALSTAPDQFILPEVTITFDKDGEIVVTASRNTVPQLRVSKLYQQLLADPNTPPETQAYIRDKIQSVRMLQRSVTQRGSTIKRIADVIVERQREFFDVGDEAMHPMTMSQVAEEIGVHETTISRAIANKYMQTPRGLYPFRHFFSTGYTSSDGDELSSHSIKTKIQALVGEEDHAKPLSDQKLVELLSEQGLKVARRTVAKYREELGIPSSHLRKSFGV
jgi:RNA polymerase sigma-54 factor